jgi:hypothetical protein
MVFQLLPTTERAVSVQKLEMTVCFSAAKNSSSMRRDLLALRAVRRETALSCGIFRAMKCVAAGLQSTRHPFGPRSSQRQ